MTFDLLSLGRLRMEDAQRSSAARRLARLARCGCASSTPVRVDRSGRTPLLLCCAA